MNRQHSMLTPKIAAIRQSSTTTTAYATVDNLVAGRAAFRPDQPDPVALGRFDEVIHHWNPPPLRYKILHTP